MRPLPARSIVRVWELGRQRPAWFRALMALSPAYPDLTVAQLASLSLGERNRRLAKVREATFGSRLTAICPCPRCATVAEFSATVHDLSPSAADIGERLEIHVGGRRLTGRRLTSEDLAALAPEVGDSTPPIADPVLVRRCFPEAFEGGAPSAEVLEAAVEGWLEHDPGAEIRVELDCSDCGEVWIMAFDWVRFLWVEIASAARRRLEEVHVLAQAYGWGEEQILGLGSARRDYYLERVRA